MTTEIKTQITQFRNEALMTAKRPPIDEWGEGELRNLVFEYIVEKLDLPWTTIPGIGEIPDFNDRRVAAWHRALKEYGDLFK